MAGTLIKRVLLQINADDGDAEAKLEAIALKADELRDKHPELKVRIDTAEAQAKMAVLRAELKDMAAQADAEAAKGGILSRFLGGSTGNSLLSRLLSGGNGKSFLRGFGSVFGKIPGLPDFGGGGGAGEAGAEGGGDLGGVGVGAGIFTLVPTVGALLVELDGLVSGFAAAGAGAGAFGLLALPAFKSVSTAYTQINTDQQAYNRALTAAQRSTALAHLKQDYANLSGPQKDAVLGIQGLVAEYHKLSNAFTPEAFKVFTGALQLASQLLPDVTPFARTFADSFSGLLKDASRFAGSAGFKDWLAQFQKLEGPSVTAIGTGVGHLVTSLGKLLTIMSAKDVVNAINIAFSVLDGTLLGIAGAIRFTMRVWDTFTTQVDQARRQLHEGAHDIAAAFDTVRHGAATAGHDTASAFDTMRHNVVASLDGQLNWVHSHWPAIEAFLGDPAGTAAGDVQRHWSQMVHQTAIAFDQERHEAARLGSDVIASFARMFGWVRREALRWTADTGQNTSRVVSFFEGLPGRIMGALARLPGELFQAGAHAASMFVSGLKQVSVIGPVIGWAQDVWDHLPHSPARKGPLSGSGSPDVAGRRIGLLLASGMEQSTSAVAASNARLARAAGIGVHGTAAGGYGAAAGPARLQLEWTGGSADQALITLLKQHIRIRGGNPSVLGA